MHLSVQLYFSELVVSLNLKRLFHFDTYNYVKLSNRTIDSTISKDFNLFRVQIIASKTIKKYILCVTLEIEKSAFMPAEQELKSICSYFSTITAQSQEKEVMYEITSLAQGDTRL